MRPQRKAQLEQLVILSWVILASACGAVGGSSPSFSDNSSTSTATDPVSVSNAAKSPKELGVGDVYQLSFTGNVSTKVDMSGVPSGAEYVLAVANMNTSGSTTSVQLASDESAIVTAASVSAPDDEDDEALSDVAARFHEELRFQEEAQAAVSHPVSAVGAGKSMVAASAAVSVPAEGSQTRFQVLSSLSGGGRTPVSATAMYVGQNVICYLDQEVMTRNPDDLTRADIQKTCSDFEKRIPQEHQIFGQESDVDGNGHLIVLFTPQINKMGAALGGLITGFFYASDLYDPGMEIIYALVPDSKGIYNGGNIPRDFVLDKLHPSVLVHEMQHAISYNQHVLTRGGQPEDPIINEGLSHLSEDLIGVGSENYARYETFLSHPSSYGLFSGGSPNLGARGASYLFLRYMLEQSGNSTSFVTKMLQTSDHGVDNVQAAFGGTDSSFDQFGQFYLRWVATLILGGEGLSKDSRYSYVERVRNATSGEWEGVCLQCNADDGRGTVIDGVSKADYNGYTSSNLMPGGVQFYSVAATQPEILLYGRGEGNFGAVLVRVK